MDGFEELEQEILYAKTETLGRMGQALEGALEELRAFDAGEVDPGRDGARSSGTAGGAPPRSSDTSRERLVARAGEALLFYVVQRESMGLRADPELLDELGVPAEVRRRMGLDPFRPDG